MAALLPRFSRFYSSAAKSNLALLRKTTGFPIGKCKQALLENNADLKEAEKWLYSQAQAEGWAKVEKLQSRSANQGLIGLLIRENTGAMVEVNCETDFVAKNENFQTLVAAVTCSLLDLNPGTLSSFLTHKELLALQCPETGTLGDMAASSVGQLGENILLQRGCLLKSSQNGVMCGHVYNNISPSNDIAMGKYATLVHLEPTKDEGFKDLDAIKQLGSEIGQHIIGLNPLVVNEGDKGVTDPDKVLTKQGFVEDEEVSVGEMLERHDAKVTTFVRYALGETAEL